MKFKGNLRSLQPIVFTNPPSYLFLPCDLDSSPIWDMGFTYLCFESLHFSGSDMIGLEKLGHYRGCIFCLLLLRGGNSASMMWGNPGQMEAHERRNLWDHSRPNLHLTSTIRKTLRTTQPRPISFQDQERKDNYCCFNPLILWLFLMQQ